MEINLGDKILKQKACVLLVFKSGRPLQSRSSSGYRQLITNAKGPFPQFTKYFHFGLAKNHENEITRQSLHIPMHLHLRKV